jgi:hypothetical protein
VGLRTGLDVVKKRKIPAPAVSAPTVSVLFEAVYILLLKRISSSSSLFI